MENFKEVNCIYNQYKLSEDRKTVTGVLSDGSIFRFDNVDYEKVKVFKWYPSGDGNANKECINRRGIHLHRYIINAPKGFEVDHIDRNRMNNCRNNLRICTHQQNQCNQHLQSNNTSGVTGVRFYKARNKYVARIKYYGKDIHLGYYITKLEAIKARDEGARLLFGEFAVLNNVTEPTQSIKRYVYEKCKIFLPDKQVAI